MASLVVLSAAVACGEGMQVPPPTITTSQPPPPATGSPPEPLSDEERLRGLAEEVAAEQRPGEPVNVAEITFFDDPEGCPTGEAALVTVEFEDDPPRGDILFCRAEQGGWELQQGILYGE
jgi:hypothetical protein